MKTTMFLVRHCEAKGNTLGVLQGRTDCDVSGNGQKQLDLVGLRLRNEPFSAIYSSPLKRAYKTAQAINQYHHLEIIKDERLVEIDMGKWEGLPWATIEKEAPEQLRIWNEDPWKFEAPGGESIVHVSERMWEAVNDIASHNGGNTVCIVSHGCAIRSFLSRALERPMNDIPWSDNTAVSVVEMENGKANVLSMNDASHIPPELSVYRSSSSSSVNMGKKEEQ
ncbi:MAG TPA: histidine phosphatase family protein [Ruminococcaceae bacterium]|jgi:broad specificity phosphatase PhoE|nr:histidine phosphatase family protein [Oscillospiraceae bacterium]